MSKDTNSQKQRLIRLIHVARRELGMEEDSYRQVLMSVAGVSSTSKMTLTQLNAVVEHLKKAGFKVRSKVQGKTQSRPLDQAETSKKIRALWLMLHQLGAVKDPSERALARYVARITSVDALQWLSAEHASQVIETLKRWALRFLPAAVNQVALKVDWQALLETEQASLSQLMINAQRGTFEPLHEAYEALLDALRRHEKR